MKNAERGEPDRFFFRGMSGLRPVRGQRRQEIRQRGFLAPDMVEVMLYQELFRRRREHRHTAGRFY